MSQAAADFLLAEDRPPIGRWLAAAAVIAAAHLILFVILSHRAAPEPVPESLSATLIDLAPPADAPGSEKSPETHADAAVPATPPDAPPEKPVEPETPPLVTPPVPPVPAPIVPAPELPVVPKPEAVLSQAPPPPPPKKVVKEKPEKKVVKHVAKPLARQADQERNAATASASSRSQAQGSGASSAAASASWKSQLLATINRHTHYPASARGDQGVAAIAFTMDRSGHVLSARLARSSGSSLLDDEAVRTLQGLGALPPPPPEVGGARIALTVPIRFNPR